MSYEAKTDWKYDETVTEGDLNRIEQGIKEAHEKSTKNEDDLETHKAEDATLTQKGHVQLSSDTDSENELLAATPKAIKEVMDKALEAFRLGNSRKKELVDLLLSLDDSLLIDYTLSWEDILNEAANVSTGKKWAEGSSTSGNTDVRSDMTGLMQNSNRMYSFQVTGLDFEPGIVIISPSSATAINNPPLVFKQDGVHASNGTLYPVINDATRYTLGGAAYVRKGEFDLPIRNSGVTMNWIAIE